MVVRKGFLEEVTLELQEVATGPSADRAFQVGNGGRTGRGAWLAAAMFGGRSGELAGELCHEGFQDDTEVWTLATRWRGAAIH